MACQMPKVVESLKARLQAAEAERWRCAERAVKAARNGKRADGGESSAIARVSEIRELLYMMKRCDSCEVKHGGDPNEAEHDGPDRSGD